MDQCRLCSSEIGGSPRIEVRLAPGEMLYYERAVLCGGVCSGIPTVQHLVTDEGEFLYYNIEELSSLKNSLSKGEWRCGELMTFLGSVLRSLLEARDHLLVPELFVLSPDKVFFQPEKRLPRLLYVPTKQALQTSFRRVWCTFLEEIDQIFSDQEWQAYSPGIRDAILDKNMGLEGILRLFQDRERRMFDTGWPSSVLERTSFEEKEKPEDLSIFRFRVFNRN